MSYSGRYDLYLGQTPSQTLGPFFHQGVLRTRAAFQVPGLCEADQDLIHNDLCTSNVQGQRIRVQGGVYDGLGNPVSDALLELWQADTHGRYQHPLDEQAQPRDEAFHGFGRAATDEQGRYRFDTIKPGRVPGPRGSSQAPHLNLIVLARGLHLHLFTRIYFQEDAREHAEDAVLDLVAPERRGTLLARRGDVRAALAEHVFDVRLQGEHETVFFDV